MRKHEFHISHFQHRTLLISGSCPSDGFRYTKLTHGGLRRGFSMRCLQGVPVTGPWLRGPRQRRERLCSHSSKVTKSSHTRGDDAVSLGRGGKLLSNRGGPWHLFDPLHSYCNKAITWTWEEIPREEISPYTFFEKRNTTIFTPRGAFD